MLEESIPYHMGSMKGAQLQFGFHYCLAVMFANDSSMADAGSSSTALSTCDIDGTFTILENDYILIEGVGEPVSTRPEVRDSCFGLEWGEAMSLYHGVLWPNRPGQYPWHCCILCRSWVQMVLWLELQTLPRVLSLVPQELPKVFGQCSTGFQKCFGQCSTSFQTCMCIGAAGHMQTNK